ncbi:MAG: DUF2252 family protein [Myxococcales bacterium]|jgi:hypothetical protein
MYGTRATWRALLTATVAASLTTGFAACAPARSVRRPGADDRRPVLHPPLDEDSFERRRPLLERLRRDPHAYFRFVHHGFTRRVCERFADVAAAMPQVNLHGDAHLQQYAVTGEFRGLADFDEATAGPAVIDLVRFGVSLELAARAHHWDAAPARRAFFDGYVAALEDPDVACPLPDVVRRIRDLYRRNTGSFLAAAERLMQPMAADARAEFLRGYERYVTMMRAEHPDLPAGYFQLVKVGRIKLGIGSALRNKLLLRIQGPTAAPGDDVVLESKELSDLSSIPCVSTAASGGGAFRVVVGQARIARVRDPLLAQVPPAEEGDGQEDRPFWIQRWLVDYRELDLMRDLRSIDDLRAVAWDVGAQLGRGHTLHIADPLDSQLRYAERMMLMRYRDEIDEAIDAMTRETLDSWERFRAETADML